MRLLFFLSARGDKAAIGRCVLTENNLFTLLG
jgi:hypothetical protein